MQNSSAFDVVDSRQVLLTVMLHSHDLVALFAVVATDADVFGAAELPGNIFILKSRLRFDVELRLSLNNDLLRILAIAR